METACNYFFDALRAPAPGALLKLQAADRSRDDPFSLAEVLSFLPDRQHAELAELITVALQPCVQNFSSPTPQVNKDHEVIVDITSHIVWLLVQDRKRPPVSEIRALIILFHSILMKLPARRAQNHIALMCEWLWAVNDPERRSIIPYTLLYLILRSFDDKSFFVNGGGDTNVAGSGSNGLPSAHSRRTCVGFVRRLYAMRRALWDLDLSVDGQSRTFRTMLLRCTTSHTFMAEGEGRKFIAYVLTLEDVRDEMLDAMVNQLSVIRSTRSPLIGNVFLHAWMKYRSDWLADRLIRVAEQAILAKRDPFATNLRMVLASFHLNKKLGAGIDVLLHHIYTPILYGNLFVANPIVRRNAVNIMADAFPIYDPGSPKEEIDAALQMQSTKLLELLTDDAPIVRQSAVTGSCRVLGMLWEILPSLTTRKMIDVITTKLSADMSSAPVRIAVFNGLRFLMENHLIHNVLKVVLPPLGRFIRDPIEKVRLGGLDLLLKVKSKRLKGLRYFDIVSVDNLIAMLTTEPEYIALKVMKLILSSHFPTEQPDWTPEQFAAIRVKACLSMLDKNPDAARFFYGHINMFVPPRPLCEFALRLSSLALEADSAPSRRTKTQSKSTKTKTKAKAKTKTKGTESKGKTKGAPQSAGVQPRRRGRSAAAQTAQQEEMTTDDIEPAIIEDVSDKENENEGASEEDDEVKTLGLENISEEYVEGRTHMLLTIVADILQSIRPSLYKEKNKSLREYLDEIYRGTALKPHLIMRGNSIAARAACWRTASCVSVSHVAPLVVLWREQMDTVVDWPRQTDEHVEGYRQLLAALVLCGIRWGIVPSILAVVAGWADGAASGRRSAFVGSKKRVNSSSSKASGKTKGKGKTKSGGSGVSTRRTRTSAQRAAAAVGTAKNNEPDVKEENEHEENDEANDTNADILGEGRVDSLYALHALGSILTDPNDEVSGELHAAIATAPSTTTNEGDDSNDNLEIDEDRCTKYDQVQSSPGRLITHMRKGVLGALDHLFEQLPNGSVLSNVPDFPLLLRVLSTVFKASVGLALRREASATEQDGELFDVREIIQWLSGPHLWANAARVNHMFAVVTCAVCVGPLADVAALQKFNAADARNLKAVFAKAGELLCDVRTTAAAGGGGGAGAGAEDPIGRFTVEGLRLALHVDLHSDALAEEGSNMDVTTTEFRESACAIVKDSLRAMRGVCFAYDDDDGSEQEEEGGLFSLKQTQVLMMRALSHIASVGHAKAYSHAMAEELTHHFNKTSSELEEDDRNNNDDDDENNNPDKVYQRVRRSYVGVTLCDGIRAMVTGGFSWAKNHDASLVFKLVWDALTDTEHGSDEAARTFVKVVRKRCVQFYEHELRQRMEDNEDDGGNNDGVRDEVKERRREKLEPFFEYVTEVVGRSSIEADDEYADIDFDIISRSLD